MKTLILTIVVCLLASSVNAALIDDLVAYWSFEEESGNLIDIHGDHDGTVTGSLGYETVGKIGTAITWDGTSLERFDIADHADFTVTAFTYSVWVAADGNVDRSICQTYGSTSGDGFTIQQENSPEGINYKVWVSGSEVTCSSNDAISYTGWTHIVAVREADGDMILYIDAVAQDDTETLAGEIDNASTLKIGVDWTNAKEYSGEIDEMGFWSRALSEAEITALNNSGACLAYPFTGVSGTRVGVRK